MGDFFGSPQGAAVLKHKTLESYLPVFARKTGSVVSVVLLDGYAGPGRYEDASPGSPEVMLAAARACQSSANVSCVFVEEDPRHRQRLRKLLDNLDDDSPVLAGTIEDHLEQVIRQCGGNSLFVFLDPFGLAIPFELLTSAILQRPRWTPRGQWQPTEVLLNFSVNGINRTAGRLHSQPSDPAAARANQTRLAELDRFLGGAWWRPIWEAESPDRVGQILQRYLQQVRVDRTVPPWRTVAVPVRDRWAGSLAYYLVLMTRHDQGLWFFADAVSRGAAALHEHASRAQPTLLPPEDLEGWVQTIQRNLGVLLERRGRFRLVDCLEAAYGDTLGVAGAKQVKRALDRLWEAGRLAEKPPAQGMLHGYLVRAPHE
jgi:three-Cys-motif partner protein